MRSFERFAGGAAIAVAVGGVAYSVAFVVAVKADSEAAANLSFVFLLLGGVLGTAVLAAVYRLTRDVGEGFALWGLLLGAVGVLGSAIHGGYDLARAIHPAMGLPGVPNAIDPRGFLTFGLTGLGLLILASLIRRVGAFPAGLGTLGMVLGLLLVAVYVARLFILDPNEPLLLGLAGVTGLVVHPWWFLWLGRSLRRAAGGG
jgi:hypothetical protein